jgi:tetratricopeptide (TPR) repeat protein
MKILPQDKWGAIVADRGQLYGDLKDYDSQLAAAEQAVAKKPNDPALQFVLGFHNYYLGRHQQAFDHLSQAIKLQPKDPFATTLRNLAAKKLGLPEIAPPEPEQSNGPALPNAQPVETSS